VALWPLLLPGALVLPGWRLVERRQAAPRSALPLPTRYTRRNLPTLGGLYSDAFAITDSGVIVGAANGPDGLGHATLWQDGAVQLLSCERSLAFAANASGGVAIATRKPGKRSQARWLQGDSDQALPGLPGFPETVAVGITDTGMLVGSAQQPQLPLGQGGTRAVVWEAGQVRELGTLGGPFSQASAVSRNGWIVGKADLSPTETHAFVYDGTRLRDLGTLGGRNSRALAVNAAGQVVGMSETATGGRQAFLWSEQTGMRALPGTDGVALALADDGTIAGQADGHAALWRPDGTRVPLDPSLVVVRGIGPHGELVGQGWAGDDLRGFCLTPSREPIR
jgi:probable HAF family extracellular repeat protein